MVNPRTENPDFGHTHTLLVFSGSRRREVRRVPTSVLARQGRRRACGILVSPLVRASNVRGLFGIIIIIVIIITIIIIVIII